jgi:hypothetical protein
LQNKVFSAQGVMGREIYHFTAFGFRGWRVREAVL